ncbi:MAG: ABC transporter permease [Bacteroidota bacterium]
MLKNYFKVAFRNLIKNPTFSFINIFGLAMGISVCLILIMLVADQKNNDKYNTNQEQIYRITHNRLNGDDFVSLYATAPLPLTEKLKSDYNDVDYAVRIRSDFGNDWVGVEDNVNIPVGGFFVDPEFIELFQFELLAGDAKTALAQPNSVVLKEETALKLYGNTDAIGKIITVGELGDYIVTGVLKDNNEQTHIKFEALASLSSLTRLEEQDSILSSTVNNWKNRYRGWVYLQLKDDVDKAIVEDHLEAINQEIYSDMEDYNHEFKLQALADISPGPLMGNEIGPGLPMIFVYFLSGLALVVMLSASFNYMNLSIARALTRAREVGVRKVSGANKPQLIIQFVIEAILISIIALVLSHAILFLLKPAFTQLHFAQLLQWNLRLDTNVIIFSLLFSVLIGFLAGILPAFTLASFQPNKVLKDLSGIKLFSKLGLRKFLIVSQFSLSLVFIISAILVFNQLKSMIGADFGFKTEDIINVQLNNTSYQQLRTELEKYPQIVNVTAATHIPASGTDYSTTLKKNWEDDVELDMSYFNVDENYISILQLELIAGTNFEQLEVSANEIIINEKSIETFELGNPHEAIGKYLIDIDDSISLKIVGVVKNYNHRMLILEISPMMLRYKPDNTNIAQVAFLPGQSKEAEAIIETSFENINPGLKVDYESFEDELTFYYNLLFGDIVSVVNVATILALIIACMGLLGMATYTIETKTKEVGIRKALGASGYQLIYQLSKGFINIIILAIIIAIPIAYFLNNLWLQKFAFRVPISFGVISLGVLILLILGVLTVGSQTYRASRLNPVDSLRNE